MSVQWRRLRAGELDHELIWLLVTASAAGMALAWLSLSLPWPACVFRAVTGLPCVTCGATRTAVALMHGDLLAAWRLNPLICAGIAAIALFDLYASVVLIAAARRLRLVSPALNARRVLVVSACAVIALNWAYLLQQ